MGWFSDLFKDEEKEKAHQAHRYELIGVISNSTDRLKLILKRFAPKVIPENLIPDLDRASARMRETFPAIDDYSAHKKDLDGQSLEELESTYQSLEHLFDGLFKEIPRGQNEKLSDYLTRFEKFLDAAVHTPDYSNGPTVLGITNSDNLPILYLRDQHRFRHTYIIGKTGSGKSTLLKYIIAQDLTHTDPKFGIILISPENDLFEDLLLFIKKPRDLDLIYFDPTDTKEPFIAFNPFHLEEGENLTQKAGETYTIFERSLGDLGVKMTTLFQNCVYALLQRPNSTILDLDRLLDPRDQTLRREITQNQNIDERTRKFWDAYQTSGYYKTAYEPTVNRLDSLLRPPLSKTLTASTFPFDTVLNGKPSILFCNLSKLRGIQAEVVGQLLLAQIQQTFFRRDDMPENERIPYLFFMDEFQTYAKSAEQSLVDMLNKFRKYKVGVTLAHQVTADIPSKLLSVLVGNAGTIVALQLASEDAPFFAKELQIKDGDNKTRPDFLQNLRVGEAYARIPSITNGRRMAFLPPKSNHEDPEDYRLYIKDMSKQIYGKKKEAPTAEAPPPPHTGEDEEDFDVR